MIARRRIGRSRLEGLRPGRTSRSTVYAVVPQVLRISASYRRRPSLSFQRWQIFRQSPRIAVFLSRRTRSSAMPKRSSSVKPCRNPRGTTRCACICRRYATADDALRLAGAARRRCRSAIPARSPGDNPAPAARGDIRAAERADAGALSSRGRLSSRAITRLNGAGNGRWCQRAPV